MDNVFYYLSIFRRRFMSFLVVATIISAISVITAYTLPPAYESEVTLLVEAPAIPNALAQSTLNTSAYEQLQLVMQQLMTRENLLRLARQFNVLPDLDKMSPDAIVEAMRARTTLQTSNPRRGGGPPMATLTFEASKPRTAAEVVNEYLTLIQQIDTDFRQGKTGDTLQFFEQEVARLGQELDDQSAKILDFERANSDALPASLQFRMSQQATYQQQLITIDQNISNLKSQRAQLIQLYEVTGSTGGTSGRSAQPQLTPDEQQLEALKSQLRDALAIYAANNPRVKVIEARIAQLEEKIESDKALRAAAPSVASQGLPPTLTLQLSDIDNQIQALEDQKPRLQEQMDTLTTSIERTPEVTIVQNELNRKYASIKTQYDQAESRMSAARTGDRIETNTQGQRITVLEQPVVPSAPTKPNRMLIAAGGTFAGIMAGLALVVVLELLNSSARRPVDIVNKLGITPLTTIPYVQTRGQRFRQRMATLSGVLVALVGIPAAVYLVHEFYLPLDLLAERAMNKFGVRW